MVRVVALPSVSVMVRVMVFLTFSIWALSRSTRCSLIEALTSSCENKHRPMAMAAVAAAADILKTRLRTAADTGKSSRQYG